MVRYLLAAALILTPCSAYAQTDTAILESIPLIIGGIGPNAPSSFGVISTGTTTLTGPGTFTIEDASHKGTISISEPEHCVFDMAVTLDGTELGVFRVDANLLSDIAYSQPSPTSSINVEFIGQEGVIMIIAPDGRSQAYPSRQSITTEADVEDMRAAAAALKEACPST